MAAYHRLPRGDTIRRWAGALPLALALLTSAVGCARAVPIRNVSNEVIPTTGKPRTLDEVSNAILEAGAVLGWTMKDKAPGQLEGTLRLRHHVAIVDIAFTTTNYSITYKDSDKLLYDGTNIHRSYNNWIQHLQTEIAQRL